MSLVPVSGVLEIVSKTVEADPDAADELVRLSLFETLGGMVDHYRPMLERDLASVMAKRLAEAKRALVRGYTVAKADGEQTEDYAQHAENIGVLEQYFAKAWNPFQRQQHPRDPYTGRFTHKISASGTAGRQEALDKWRQWIDQGLATPQSKVYVRTKTGQVHQTAGHDLGAIGELADQGHEIDRLELDNPRLNPQGPQRQAAMDVMAPFVGQQAAARTATAMPITSADLAPKVENWNRGTAGTDRQAYRRMQLTGQALQAVSTPGRSPHTVGALAELVGNLGPEAEKVLAPGIRRTAYRYRGTEKTPPKRLQGEVLAAGARSANLQDEAFRTAVQAATRRGEVGPVEGVLGYYSDPSVLRQYMVATPSGADVSDALRLRVQADVATGYLSRRLPDTKLTEISLKAGRVPPSQGVIIDRDGDVVVEAMGYNGDHYLPFDLKNLKRLSGGQYVRTRAMGGPTSEDIYTGLLTNTRQLQVVSNSGVFTVDFDPDLRGGRRYSDKARQMIGRYQHLLDAIESGGLYQQDLPKAEERRIRQEALAQTGYDETYAEPLIEERLRAARAERGFSMDDDELHEVAHDEVTAQVQAGEVSAASRGEIGRLINDRFLELKDKQRQERVKEYKLDGEGYFAALRSLQQEFPYFIRQVDYKPLPEFLDERRLRGPGEPRAPRSGGRDKGYVLPGQTSAVTERWYNRHMPKVESAAGKPTEEEPTKPGTGGGPGKPLDTKGDPIQVPMGKLQPTAPLTDALQEASRGMRSDIGRTLSAVGRYGGGQPPPEGKTWPKDKDEIRSWPAATFLYWLNESNHGSAGSIADQVINGDQEFVSHVAQSMREMGAIWQRDPDLHAYASPEDIDGVQAKLQTLDTVKAPFAVKAPDPVLARPSLDNPKPQPFASINALGTNLDNYEAFLVAAANGSQDAKRLAEQAQGYMGSSDENIRKDIETNLDVWEAAKSWAGDPMRKPSAIVEQAGIDHRTAARIADEKSAHLTEPYRVLAAKQMAWSFVRAAHAAAELGQRGGVVPPKAESAPQSQPAEVGKRSVVWERPDSPVAKGLGRLLAKVRPL